MAEPPRFPAVLYTNDRGEKNAETFLLSEEEASGILAGCEPAGISAQAGKTMAKATFTRGGVNYAYVVFSPRGSPAADKGALPLRGLRALLSEYVGCKGRGKSQYFLRLTDEGAPSAEAWADGFWELLAEVRGAR